MIHYSSYSCQAVVPLIFHLLRQCSKGMRNRKGFISRTVTAVVVLPVRIFESDVGEPELCHDLFDDNGTKCEYDLIIVDEGHQHVFRKWRVPQCFERVTV